MPRFAGRPTRNLITMPTELSRLLGNQSGAVTTVYISVGRVPRHAPLHEVLFHYRGSFINNTLGRSRAEENNSCYTQYTANGFLFFDIVRVIQLYMTCRLNQ
jgi:hypothetical protein